MTIYLVQHGVSLSKDKDPEQSLTDAGVAEVERIASVAKGYGVPVAVIQHSVKKRARQTAEIMAAALTPAGGIVEAEGLKPMDDVVPVAQRLKASENLMLVGHLPFMERLTSFLTTGSLDNTVFRFQNGGIVALDHPPDRDRWAIRWALMPRIG
jgi:phosphohistidine phosphatase